MNLNEYAEKINRTSTDHGFWPEEGRNMGEMLMLAVSELAEALEENRSDKPVQYYTITLKPDTVLSDDAAALVAKIRDARGSEITPGESRRLVEYGIAKPEGLAVELADCIIRCLDTMQSLGVDIDAVVQEKMAYNNSRPHKHGKAY